MSSASCFTKSQVPTRCGSTVIDAPSNSTSSTLPGSEIEGYRIYQGTTASNLTVIAEVGSSSTSFTVEDLARGTHHFAVTTLASGRVESAFSAVGSKTIN